MSFSLAPAQGALGIVIKVVKRQFADSENASFMTHFQVGLQAGELESSRGGLAYPWLKVE